MHVLNKVFDSNIALLASVVTAIDNSSSYEPTGLSFSVIFVIWLWFSTKFTECSGLQGSVAAIIR